MKTDPSTWQLLSYELYEEWRIAREHEAREAQWRAQRPAQTLAENREANPDQLPAASWCKAGPHPEGRACAECAPTIEHHLAMKGVYGT